MLCLAATPVVAQAQLPKRQIVEDLRLDATAEDFPDVGAVVVGPRGQIVVAVNKDMQLRFYDAAGKRTAIFGRRGSGPEEFQRKIRHGWIGDTLWAYDGALRRVTYISPEAKLLRSEVLTTGLNTITTPGEAPAVGSVGLFIPAAVVPGRYVGTAIMVGSAGGDRILSVGIRAATTDTVRSGDRLFLATSPSPDAFRVDTRSDKGTTFGATVPFTFYPVIQFSPDGSRFGFLSGEVVGKRGSYTITMFSTKGDTIFQRAYPFSGDPIPKSVVDSAIERIGRSADGKPTFPPDVSLKLRELARPRVPQIYAPLSNMLIGIDATVWVMGRVTPQGTTATAMDQRGTPLFVVDLPPRTRLVQANRTTLWTIQTDDDDLPSVVRYRIK